MKAFIVLYALCSVLGIAMILLLGYPGDGARGYPTAFGRMERATSPQIARGWR
jgi:hypothetical protein